MTILLSEDFLDLNLIFSYFDTNHDGILTNRQAICAFQLLGLDKQLLLGLIDISLDAFLDLIEQTISSSKKNYFHEIEQTWNMLDPKKKGAINKETFKSFLSSVSIPITKEHLESLIEFIAREENAEFFTKEGFLLFYKSKFVRKENKILGE